MSCIVHNLVNHKKYVFCKYSQNSQYAKAASWIYSEREIRSGSPHKKA